MLKIVAMIAAFALSSAAHGEEVVVKNLDSPIATIKTSDISLHFGNDFQEALTSTEVRCLYPSCILRIGLSSQFQNIASGGTVAVAILVDGLQEGVLPAAVLGFDSPATTSGASTVRSFTWMRTVARGKHRIDVFFSVTVGEADSPDRTLTVDVYRKPYSN